MALCRIKNFDEIWCLVALGGYDFCVSSTIFQKSNRLASRASNRKNLSYQLKIGFSIIPYIKRDSYGSFWCQGWSNHQVEERFWGNRAVEDVEAVAASEVAEADEVNEAAEVSKGSKIITGDIQVLECSLFWHYFEALKKKGFLVESWNIRFNF